MTGTAAAQEAGDSSVRDLVLEVRDLDLATASLDRSVTTTESGRRVQVTLAADILFAFDSARLTGNADTRIDQAVREIREVGPTEVRIEGHTDSKGTDAYNLDLSKRRAEAVRGALTRKLGADAPRVEIVARGEADPVAPNTKPDGSDNPAGRKRNRRVEVIIPRS